MSRTSARLFCSRSESSLLSETYRPTARCPGTGAKWTAPLLTVDGHESKFGANHYAHFLLCGLLFARIEAAQGQILVVRSLMNTTGIKTRSHS